MVLLVAGLAQEEVLPSVSDTREFVNKENVNKL